VKEFLLGYLRTSGRMDTMDSESALWTSHDRTNLHSSDQLTGHAFAKRVKMYARWACIGDVHLHQTRHTFTRWVSESTGNIIEAQDALGHKHAATTRATCSGSRSRTTGTARRSWIDWMCRCSTKVVVKHPLLSAKRSDDR
jgi:integrase